MTLLVSAFLISYGLCLVIQTIRWMRLILGFPELQPLKQPTKIDSSPLVSIIIPARNEEAHITECLTSIKRQEYPNFEVIVVNDESTDRTAELITKSEDGIILIQNPPLPKDWVGKSWACHNGFLVSKGEWLLFTDADSVHLPNSLSAAVEYAIYNRVDMLTVWPLMKMVSFWEKLILPIVFRYFFIDFRGRYVNEPDSNTWAAFGMYILIRKETYKAIGGHANIKIYTDEDYRLAEIVKKNRFSLRVLRGHRIVEKRMYESLSTMWEGWVKNSFAGFNYKLKLCLYEMMKLGIGSVVPAVLTFLVFVIFLLESPLPESIIFSGLILYSIVVIREVLIRRQMGYSRWHALLTFLGETLFIAMNIHSAFCVLTGRGVTWKGRIYSDIPKS